MSATAPDPETQITRDELGPSTLDGLPTRAMVIVTKSRDDVIVWHVNLAGSPCGAWVLPADEPTTPLRVLRFCDRRGLLSPDGVSVVDLLVRMAKSAEVDVARSTLGEHLCTLPDLLNATANARATYEAQLREDEEVNARRYAPFEWATPVPNPIPDTQEALAAAALVRLVDDPITGEALNLAYLTKWAIGLWRDTERARSRRKGWRERYGPRQPLPACWRTPITSAYREPFDC